MRIKADKLAKARDRITEVVNRALTDSNLAEMERRAEYDATGDGFGDGSGGGDRNAISRPTEAAGLALLESHFVIDPQMRAFEIIRTETLSMRTSAVRIEKAWSVVTHIQDGRRGRETTLGTCNACLRSDVANSASDRIKSGYCPACYTEWRRRGQPDRLAFEVSRRGDDEE